jgi:hypothetical protein
MEIEKGVAETAPLVAAAPCAEPIGLLPLPLAVPDGLLGLLLDEFPPLLLEAGDEADGRALMVVHDAAEFAEAVPAL